MKPYVCHSGGAQGADFYFENFGNKFHVRTIAYSYKTPFHNSLLKKELTEQEFFEGCEKIEIANVALNRFKYQHMLKLLARNWFQVKYSDEVFAVGSIKSRKGNIQFLKGGTGWAVQMAIDRGIPVYVYDQDQLRWFSWSYALKMFQVCVDNPIITKKNFTGIGTRRINLFGINAIEDLYERSFGKKKLNILYLHGLESKLSDVKREILEEFGDVIAPDLNYFTDPNCIQNIYNEFKNVNIDLIIGSSMGGFVGFYLSQMMEKNAFLFNPALKERSVYQSIPNQDAMKTTKITILLGDKDDVVPNYKTFRFLDEYDTKSQITLLINYEMSHGVPVSVFENELAVYLRSL